ncbi:hypothetical protein CC78DRAFT_535184 [Lojkania enalia]|uniref:Phosphoglycerate mutase n=1 Tax=Lojkania enalia TaxID=147567 RepID=A0A9P4K8F3_9PLEO|nr:hypothetical protein CC78DRAFT_535184 [Didymosphaeria enalia]
MAKGPAVVFFVRHGARLDAADKQWHLTSPTPYDPPLTYGGWTQSKALGLRIASLLHAREIEQSAGKANGATTESANLESAVTDALAGGKTTGGASAGATPQPKRKHKIIIHSSPYLRCIQTSTAIAAGISQFQSPSTALAKQSPPAKDRNGLYGPSSLTRTKSVSASPAVQPLSTITPSEHSTLQALGKTHHGPDKILLRVDAFLGEWLSPDYFEDITPPPNSTMMVAGAKADLLRRGDYVEVQHNAHNSKGHFPGGWVKGNGASPATGRSITHDSQFPTMGSLAQALPHRERACSQGSVSSHSSRTGERGAASLSTAHKVPSHIYDPPVPSYAVSPAEPIPRGYVSHARDACVDVDFQWDSMREPQEWGDGGDYGDEWSTMHKRFRKGLAGMMAWYKEHGAEEPKDKIPGFMFKHRTSEVVPEIRYHVSDPGPGTSASEEEDIILVLVTHGAGCNALLGAISNQPVLLDIGLASLSMAVRRDEPLKPSTSVLTARRPSFMEGAISEEYEVKSFATVDHLRPGVDPSKLPQPQSPAIVASPSLEYRRRFNSPATGSPIDSPFSIGEPYRPVNSSLGSMRRSSTSGSSSSRFLSNDRHSSTGSMTGLWSNLRPPMRQESQTSDGRHSPGQDMIANFQMHKPKLSSVDTDVSPNTQPVTIEKENKNGAKHEGENDDVPPLPGSLGASLSPFTSQGLWGPKKAVPATGLWGPGVSVERERGPKRRWTVNEQDA